MTIIPLLPQPVPEVEPYYRLLPATWCYRCGDDFSHRIVPAYDCRFAALPETPKSVLIHAAVRSCDCLALPAALSDWHPADTEAARDLAALLLRWADCSESFTTARDAS